MKSEKGVALIIVIFAMMLFAVLGVTLAVMQSSDFEVNLRNLDSERALNLAEAGSQWMLNQLINNSTGVTKDSHYLHSLNFGQYDVLYRDSDTGLGEPAGKTVIQSTGYIPNQAQYRGMRIVKLIVTFGGIEEAVNCRYLFDWSAMHSGSALNGDLSVTNRTDDSGDGYEGDGDTTHNEAGVDVGNSPSPVLPPGSGARESPTDDSNYPEIDMADFEANASNKRDYSATAIVSNTSSGETLEVNTSNFFNSSMDDEPEIVRIVGANWSNQNWVVIKDYKGEFAGKSRVTVYLKDGGEEKVTNGTFNGNALGWTLGSGWTYASDAVRHDSAETFSLSQTLGITIGRKYKLTYLITDWENGAGRRVTPYLGGQIGTACNGNGTYTEIFTVTTTDALAFVPTSAVRCTIDNVSVTEVVDMSNWIDKAVKVVKRFAGNHNNEGLWYIKGDILIDARSKSQTSDDEEKMSNINKEAKLEHTSLCAEGDIVIRGFEDVILKAHIDESANRTYPNLSTKTGNINSDSGDREFDGVVYTETGNISFDGIKKGICLLGYNITLDGVIKLDFEKGKKYTSEQGFNLGLSEMSWQEQ